MFIGRLLGEKGVSPVIGTFLPLVMTIVLASMLASFVFGLANEKIELSKRIIENLQNTIENYSGGV